MTVKAFGTTIFHWNQFSTDVKPSSGVTEGSTAHNVDTGEEFIYHNGMWVQDLIRIYALSFVNN